MQYVIMPPLQQVIHDVNTGGLLTNGYVYFYRDTARTELKPIYELTNGVYTRLANPMRLSGIGSYINEDGANIVPYLLPYSDTGGEDLYYIRVYSEGMVHQFDMEAWPDGAITGGADTPQLFANSLNQITNPQFVDVDFAHFAGNSQTFTVSGSNHVTPVAPGWDLITSGNGQVEVTWVNLVETNSSHALELNASGVSAMALRQRFYSSPRLLINEYVQGSVVGRSMTGGLAHIKLIYRPSSGDEYIFGEGDVENAAYTSVGGVALIDGVVNSNPPPGGFVDFVIEFDAFAHVRVTNIQMMTVPNAESVVPFVQQSDGMQVDHMYHLDRQWLYYKPATGYLTGWDFAVNPAQFGGENHVLGANAGIGQGGYIWDQTICGRAGSGTYNISRNPTTRGFTFVANADNCALMMMQYVPKDEIINAVINQLSVHVKVGAISTGTIMRVHLFRAPASAAYPAIPYSVAGDGLGAVIGNLSPNGEFTLTQPGWTEVPRGNRGQAIAGISGASIVNGNYGFTGWRITEDAQINDSDKFAIVITFATEKAGDWVSVSSVNLLPGEIPCIPSPQSGEQAYMDCASFYEKTYASDKFPDGITNYGGAIFTPAILTSQIQPDWYPTWRATTINFIRKHKQLAFNEIYFYSPISGTQSRMALGCAVPNALMSFPYGSFPMGTPRTGSPVNGGLYYSSATDHSLMLAPARTHFDDAGSLSNSTVWSWAFHYIVDCRIAVTHTT